jgi:hypothetical protein
VLDSEHVLEEVPGAWVTEFILSENQNCQGKYIYLSHTFLKMMCCLLVLDSVTSTPQWIRQPRARVYLEEGTYHTRLFRGPSTNEMKKMDGPSRSWPTPHTTPFFLPPEDPSPVLLRPNSIPE